MAETLGIVRPLVEAETPDPLDCAAALDALTVRIARRVGVLAEQAATDRAVELLAVEDGQVDRVLAELLAFTEGAEAGPPPAAAVLDAFEQWFAR